ncbi:MAG: DUF6064 family protein [Candidatus Thorarchaeota archaeon]
MSATEFFNIMGFYNSTYWLITVLTVVFGVLAVILVVRKTSYSDRAISLILAILWLWVGLVFGFIVFGPWTPIAFGIPIPGFGYFFGITFTLQGILLLYYGVYRKSLSFKFETDPLGLLGLLLIIYAVLFYGLVGLATGYPFPFYPLFGTSPCPVTIFTIGLFLWADKRISPLVFVLPTILALIGLVPVLAFGVFADFGLFLSGFICLFLLFKHWKGPQPAGV